jgi:hypothetical protein
MQRKRLTDETVTQLPAKPEAQAIPRFCDTDVRSLAARRTSESVGRKTLESVRRKTFETVGQKTGAPLPVGRERRDAALMRAFANRTARDAVAVSPSGHGRPRRDLDRASVLRTCPRSRVCRP